MKWYDDLMNWVILTRIGATLYWLLQGKLLYKRNDCYVLQDIIGDNCLYFPEIQYHPRFMKRHQQRYRESYFNNPEAPLEDGDVVVDIGAFIGATSLIASEYASQVFAVEPSPRALQCLHRNVDDNDTITVIEAAAWDSCGTTSIQFGQEPNEDSLIQPDDGPPTGKKSVQTITVEWIEKKHDVKVDFLKVEAEGVEPEIVSGNNGVAKKVVSTGNAERLGETTYDAVAETLRKQGYDVTIDTDHKYRIVTGVRG